MARSPLSTTTPRQAVVVVETHTRSEFRDTHNIVSPQPNLHQRDVHDDHAGTGAREPREGHGGPRVEDGVKQPPECRREPVETTCFASGYFFSTQTSNRRPGAPALARAHACHVSGGARRVATPSAHASRASSGAKRMRSCAGGSDSSARASVVRSDATTASLPPAHDARQRSRSNTTTAAGPVQREAAPPAPPPNPASAPVSPRLVVSLESVANLALLSFHARRGHTARDRDGGPSRNRGGRPRTRFAKRRRSARPAARRRHRETAVPRRRRAWRSESAARPMSVGRGVAGNSPGASERNGAPAPSATSARRAYSAAVAPVSRACPRGDAARVGPEVRCHRGRGHINREAGVWTHSKKDGAPRAAQTRPAAQAPRESR